jgi:hypothetical protein
MHYRPRQPASPPRPEDNPSAPSRTPRPPSSYAHPISRRRARERTSTHHVASLIARMLSISFTTTMYRHAARNAVCSVSISQMKKICDA